MCSKGNLTDLNVIFSRSLPELGSLSCLLLSLSSQAHMAFIVCLPPYKDAKALKAVVGFNFVVLGQAQGLEKRRQEMHV